ncbi:MAG: glycosyltransferase [Terracidiphilus sp.]
MIDLAVAYRVYPGVSKTPAFFPTDKFNLSKMCLDSFRKALGGLRVKIWALLDGCPPEYEDLFRDTFGSNNLEVLPLDKVGNHTTFLRQIDLLASQTEAPYVYFAEDDYFYFPGALEKMIAFMRQNQDVDFVTPYDHPDSYYTSARHERHLVRPFGDRYWRSASSTCLTFLTSRATLIRTRTMFKTYGRGNPDCSLWLALTQRLGLADPRVHWHDLFRFKLWLYTLRWGFPALLFGKRYRLWSPLPTLATHMESTCLSPLIDWQTTFVGSQPEQSIR